MTDETFIRIEQFKDFMEPVFYTDEIEDFCSDLQKLGFFEAPASIQHHSTTPGGLFDHSLCVSKCLLHLTRQLDLKWQQPRSPFIVGMLHDLCKCDNYRRCPEGEDQEHWEYNNASILPGHGEKSVIMAQQLLPLTDEEVACIRWHMGAFEDPKYWNNYGRAVTAYPNVLFTHTADMMAARIRGI